MPTRCLVREHDPSRGFTQCRNVVSDVSWTGMPICSKHRDKMVEKILKENLKLVWALERKDKQ